MTPDPDLLVPFLGEYIHGDPRPGVPNGWRLLDVSWPLFVAAEPRALMRLRTRQKMELGRYGRQSVLQWEECDLAEFLGYYQALLDIVKNEHATSSVQEDQ